MKELELPAGAHQAAATCTREQAETLVKFDHHRVKVGERWGILISYPLMPLEEAQEPLAITVIFNPSPRHLPTPDQIRSVIFKHPLAPAEVQQIVDQLHFEDIIG